MSELVFVGTSDAFGAGGRRQSAILLRTPSGTVLIDCGVTTNTGLGALAIDRNEIDTIVISHFHADHFGGIPLLLLASQYSDRRRDPLRIAGPPGTERRVRQLADAMGHRIDERNFGFELEFLELPTGDEREIGPVRARTFQTHHQPDTHPHGMLIETGEERIAYSGDTGWFDGLPEQVAGSALFICECTFLTPQYEFHLDHETLTQQRERFDCGRWILTHLGGDMSQAREEMRQAGQATSHTGKEGGFETADDGLVVEL